MRFQDTYDSIKIIVKTRENQVQTIDIKEVKQEVVDKMEQYKQEFIEFMVESDVLKFWEFTLKSGRKSPFFRSEERRVGKECDRADWRV